MAWQIVGHDWAVNLLRQSLMTSRVAHAYLFSGPGQIGKTTLALALAQALNCTQSDPPCGLCPSCTRIARHVHPDVQLIVGQGAGQSIKIDQVRAVRRETVLAPYEGRYRVYILRRMDRASIEAANSLLKTLEEPPAHVVLVLTATRAETLPATVVSRCQRLDLRPTSYRVLEASLRENGLSRSKAQLLARVSGRRVGWALRACEDATVLHQRQQSLDQLRELLSADRVERFDFAWKASRDAEACCAQIELWISWWRDLLLMCGQGEDNVINVDRLDDLRSVAKHSTMYQAWAALRALQMTVAQLEANVNARLALEGLMLKLPHWPTMTGSRVS